MSDSSKHLTNLLVKAGEVVRVKVMEVDAPRKRIGLSMRLADKAGDVRAPRGGERRPPRNAPQKRGEAPGGNKAFAAAFAAAKQKSRG